MKWNDGKERTTFERKQAKKRKDYLAAGMTEGQIQSLYEYDLAWYRSRRREARHTQRLNITAFDEDDGDDEAQNPLIKKFLHSFSVEDKHFENDRFGWIEQILDRKLYVAIKSLTDMEKEILTELLYDGFTQDEIAQNFGRNQSSISRRIARLKNILKNFL